MESSEYLESKLSSIEHGAVAFKVLAFVLAWLGVVQAFVAGVMAISLQRDGLPFVEVALGVANPLMNCVTCFMLFWFLKRAGLLFWTVAALIREMREVV